MSIRIDAGAVGASVNSGAFLGLTSLQEKPQNGSGSNKIQRIAGLSGVNTASLANLAPFPILTKINVLNIHVDSFLSKSDSVALRCISRGARHSLSGAPLLGVHRADSFINEIIRKQ